MIVNFKGKLPKVAPTAFIAKNAWVIGDVEIGPDTNIWFYSIVRGDLNYIRIGSNCNIQDACGIYLFHRAAVIGQHGQEAYKLFHFLFRI